MLRWSTRQNKYWITAKTTPAISPSRLRSSLAWACTGLLYAVTILLCRNYFLCSHPPPLALTLFLSPLLQGILRQQKEGCDTDVLFTAEFPAILSSLYIDQSGVLRLISICYNPYDMTERSAMLHWKATRPMLYGQNKLGNMAYNIKSWTVNKVVCICEELGEGWIWSKYIAWYSQRTNKNIYKGIRHTNKLIEKILAKIDCQSWRHWKGDLKKLKGRERLFNAKETWDVEETRQFCHECISKRSLQSEKGTDLKGFPK